MNCPACHNPNPPAAAVCEFCGHSLAEAPPRRTVLDRDAAAPDPGKRRTLYDPGAAAAARPVDPFAVATRARPPSSPPTLAPREPAGDPFAAAVARAPAAAPAPEATAPARPAARTVAERPDARRVAGVLVAATSPADPGRIFALREGRNTLGRDEGQDVRLDDPKVSAQHGFVFCRAEGSTFIDVSTNGSLLDGALVHGQQGELKPGSLLHVGGTVLVFLVVPPVPASAWEQA